MERTRTGRREVSSAAVGFSRDDRTYFDPAWYTEQQRWIARTLEELERRLREQHRATRSDESAWRRVGVRRPAAPGGVFVMTVRRDVYADPPGDPATGLLRSLHQKWPRAEWE